MASHRRIAIVGTAQSWNLTPWQDTALEIFSLNDAYQLDGFQRADVWYDFHPLNKMLMTPKVGPHQKVAVMAHTIPPDAYMRPYGHLDWLATQPMTKYLHPDHVAQLPESANWPNVKPFPKAECEAYFGRYFTSSPTWMLAHAVIQGIRDIQIYGIHLSTESEYIEQRPGFEYLIGCILGRGKHRISVHRGIRRYETNDGVVALPEASPILSATYQYAFDVAPRRKLEPLKWELHKAEVKHARAIQALREARWPLPWVSYDDPIPNDPAKKTIRRRVLSSTLKQELVYYDMLVADCRDQLSRQQGAL